MKIIVTDGRLRRTIYKHITVCSNPKSSRQGGILTVARLPKDVLITTQPVRIFPNEDYLYVEISRANVQYECRMKMARKGDPSRSLDVARALGKTMREAEDKCYQRALERFPRLPRPPYRKKGLGASRTLLKSSPT
jgi:hypothetical protein